jgi:hypothetical protein
MVSQIDIRRAYPGVAMVSQIDIRRAITEFKLRALASAASVRCPVVSAASVRCPVVIYGNLPTLPGCPPIPSRRAFGRVPVRKG